MGQNKWDRSADSSGLSINPTYVSRASYHVSVLLVLGALHFPSCRTTVCDCHWDYPLESYGQPNQHVLLVRYIVMLPKCLLRPGFARTPSSSRCWYLEISNCNTAALPTWICVSRGPVNPWTLDQCGRAGHRVVFLGGSVDSLGLWPRLQFLTRCRPRFRMTGFNARPEWRARERDPNSMFFGRSRSTAFIFSTTCNWIVLQ